MPSHGLGSVIEITAGVESRICHCLFPVLNHADKVVNVHLMCCRFLGSVIGIAVTVRYVPTNKPPAPQMETSEFDRWVGNWYSELSSEPFVPLIRKGTALVFDDASDSDVGSIGSNNIMGWKLRGCVGVVTNATARDTDEIATEKVPLYFREVGRGIRPGRNEIESVNRPYRLRRRFSRAWRRHRSAPRTREGSGRIRQSDT
jgi:regulator of RNase E activity RraA